jgi:prepilin-type processing-associated H-X9-DG protein
MHYIRGFSPVEVLITITAMLILMVLLLGWVSRDNELARSSDCLYNLHQLADAAQQYNLSNHGAFPSDCQTASGYWYPELQPYDTDMSRNALCPDASTASGGVGTSSQAWGPIPMFGPPYFTGYPWLANTIASYGMNTLVNPTGQTPIIAGAIDSTGPFSNNGNGTIVQGHAPSLDPRQIGKNWLISQPLFADAIWVDGSPQTGDPAPSNLLIGNSTLISCDEMGIFCINRHLGQVNVVFTDGSAHGVPLAQLWQLNWSANYTPTQVKVTDNW